MDKQKDIIQYNSESEIEIKDNIICKRVLKFTSIAIVCSIMLVLTIIFISKTCNDKNFQDQIFNFLFDRIDAIATFFIG